MFPGRPAPYVETDAPSALSEYARAKLDAEGAVAAACPGAVLIRTSLLYDTVELARVQRDVVDAITGATTTAFFTDEVRCPAHADDVAVAVSRLAGVREVAGPLHVAGPDAVSRHEFATRTALLLGLDPALIRATTLAAAGLVRPGHVVLDSSRAAALGIRCRPMY